MRHIAVIREDDDPIATTRISLGTVRMVPDNLYLVFRGEPADLIKLLEDALEAARILLPEKMYEDLRQRHQG
jgi:hypothetical protein